VTTVITKTIGPSGRDYANFILAEADVESLATAEFGSTDLVANDGAIVFEADAGTYTGRVFLQSTLTTDATRNVTYKPAAGSEHNGDKSSGVIVPSQNTSFVVYDPHTVLDGLVIPNTGGYCVNTNGAATGAQYRNCIFDGSQGTSFGVVFLTGGTVADPIVVENCVGYTVNTNNFYTRGIVDSNIRIVNCTAIASGTGRSLRVEGGSSTSLDVEVVNMLSLASRNYQASNNYTITGSNNVGGSTSPFPVAIQGSPATITASTAYDPGAGDYALYVGKNGALLDSPNNDVVDQGIGPASNSDVPTTDILGNARSGATANPGAFEVPQATTVITRTIGATGRDYASFTLAEADVENIGTSADSENVIFESTLTTDATRQVTYKPAAGSEHGGVAGAGVRIQFGNLAVASNCVSIKEAFTALDGLELDWTDVTANGRTVDINLDVRGVSISNCLIRYAGTGRAIYHFQASTYDLTSYPVTITNCAVYAPSGDGAIFYNYGASDEAFTVTNCTFTCRATSGKRAIQSFTNEAGYTTTLTLTNNLVLAGGSYITATGGSGVVTVLGSNNFGGSTDPFPAAIQGSPYPITASQSYDPGAGDYALYVGKNGALLDSPNNDVIDGGVGPSVNSDVPTTDILGNARSGATANPGAFEEPQATTVLTRTIGPSGRDYANFTLAEADVENIGTSADLLNENEAIVFEADAGTYNESVIFQSSLTTDTTRNVTYKPATGSEHGGIADAGVLITFGNLALATATITVKDAFTVFDGLDIRWTQDAAAGRAVILELDVRGVSFSNCLIRCSASSRAVDHSLASTFDLASYPPTFTNCVVDAPNAGGLVLQNYGASDKAFTVTNCTFLLKDSKTAVIGRSDTANTTYTLTNNIVLVGRSWSPGAGAGVTTVTGSNNFGGSTDPFPVAIQASSQTWTFTTDTDESTSPSTGSQVVYDATTGALVNSPNNDAVGEGTSTSIPTTDINGADRIRGTYADPGAFTTELVTFNRTIGATGRDYATFTAAEADVVNISTNGNLQKRNEAIVFEADAGDYTEDLTFFTGGALTCDPTRNVTFKAASGAGHGGEFESGANIVGSCTIRESFAVVDGLSVSRPTGLSTNVTNGVDGVILRNLMSASTDGHGIRLTRGGTASNPNVVENCVAKSDSSRAFDIRSEQAESHWRVVNCTAMATGINQGFIVGQSSTGNTIYLELVNNVVIGGTSRSYFAFSGPTYVVTGSNNFGPDDGSAPFPVAIQGSPYPVTPTADTYNPGAAGDYALYDSTTGKLIYSVHNDVVDQGIGPSANSDVPTTDILGNARSGATANPGAFEELYVIDPTVITKTIGQFGRDYLSFTLAEADVENIGTSDDLVENNEAIVFEADAGIYSESVNFQSTLTADATRNVTYKPAVGSEHGGLSSAGVRLATTGSVLTIRDYFTTLDGLVADSATSNGIRNLAADGVLIRNCVVNAPEGQGIKADYGNIGTAAAPFTVENCVVTAKWGAIIFTALYGAVGPQHFAVRNCTLKNTGSATAILTMNSADTNYGEFTNNLVLEGDVYNAVGSNVITGSNNFGGSTNPFPAALQGSPYPITPTADTYNPGAAGDYALYDSTSGKLIYSVHNDVVDQGVGPASNSDVPTTDINGVARSGATSNPGAFEELYVIAPTVITRTIGATGRDYTSFTLAEADVTNIGTSDDLVENNEAIVIEADAGTYTENVTFYSTLTTDATRNVTYKPATGSEHGGSRSAGAIIEGTGSTYTVDIRDNYVALDGLVMARQSDAIVAHATGSTGFSLNACIIDGENGTGAPTFFRDTGGSTSERAVISNCIVFGHPTTTGHYYYTRTIAQDAYIRIVNCTAIGDNLAPAFRLEGRTGFELDVEIINCLALNPRAYLGSSDHTITGSNNFGGSTTTQPFPVAIQGSPYPVAVSKSYDPGAGDYALYVGKNGALLDSPNNDVVDQGVGPSVNSDVPTTDILGNARSGATANPGAFEEPQATATLTRTIGPVSRDYASFSLAEADVTNIGGSADLTFENEAIVFEADAGTYSENVTIQSTLTTDATRNVTYKPATGSEHGGSKSAGVIIEGTGSAYTLDIRDDYVALDGLVMGQQSGAIVAHALGSTGFSLNSCIIDGENATSAPTSFRDTGGSTSERAVISNCIVFGLPTGNSHYFYTWTVSQDAYFRIVNCTTIGDNLGPAFRLGPREGRVLDVEIINCLALNPRVYADASTYSQQAFNDYTITGSNNFGGAAQPFPAALQGSPYPISVTTSTDPGVGDFAIVDADTGQLIDDSDNDVINQGIGPAANSDVPTTGIAGGVRSGATTHPGAFATLKRLGPAPIIPDAIDYGMPGGYSVASILFENSTTCYLNGVQKTVLSPGQDLSLPLFRSTSADVNKDLVIVSNTRPNKQILLHNYSWGHAGLDTTQPLYEPMLSWFTAYGSAVEGDGIALITPRYVGDMDRTTPLEVALPPGKSLALSFVSFPSTPPNTTLVAALTVTYEIVDAGGSSTFTNTYVN
jgi:hypothetical protein